MPSCATSRPSRWTGCPRQTAGGHPSGTTPGSDSERWDAVAAAAPGPDEAGGVLAAWPAPARRRAWSNCAVGLTTTSRPAMSQRSWMRCSTWSRLTPPDPAGIVEPMDTPARAMA